MQDFFAMKGVLYPEKDIQQRVTEMAADIDDYYRKHALVIEQGTGGHNAVGTETVLVICIAKGAVYFCADLTRKLHTPIELELMSLRSYVNGTTSSGDVQVAQDISTDVKGRYVLVIEDIVDTGFTMDFLISELKRRGAKDVCVAALLSKPSRRKVNVTVNFIGFEVDDVFTIGYGMDIDGICRELPYIATLDEERYRIGCS